jgi:subtilisin inhibitor-like
VVALAAVAAALTITVWPEGSTGPSHMWTLRCGPVGGTLPARADACDRLSGLSRPFAPVPAGTVCAQIYGGPQVAFVRGTFRGKRVWTFFRRRDSCEIARWKRVKFLFP